MNPLFGGMMPGMMGGMNRSPMNMINMIQQIRQMQQNPNGLADLLKSSGKINQQQYDEIKAFNGDAKKIGEYLIHSGSMPQQQVQQAYQNIVPQVQNELNKTM